MDSNKDYQPSSQLGHYASPTPDESVSTSSAYF